MNRWGNSDESNSFMVVYKFLNIVFFVFHIALILFNVFGWIVPPWRRLNLWTLGITLFSWVVLGIFYGFGYCFLTDWHYAVRDKLGLITESNSYIHFLVTHAFGVSITERIVDIVTVVVFFAVVIISVLVNIRDRKHESNR